jgi:hypothetical protein
MDAVYETPRRRLDWARACYAGLIAGGLLLMFSGGTPWSSTGHATVMGRMLEEPSKMQSDSGLMTMVLHMGVAVCYAILIIPVIFGLPATLAILTGGAIGAVLYFINYWISSTFGVLPVGEGEIIILVTHAVFGLLVAGAYKGLGRSRTVP